MGDRGVRRAVLLIYLTVAVSELALGVERSNASIRRPFDPMTSTDKRRKRDGDTELVIEHVEDERNQAQESHLPVEWLVALAIIIAILLLVLLYLLISRLSEPKPKYRRLYSVSNDSNPAQAFTYIDLTNGEPSCAVNDVPQWRITKVPCEITHHCGRPRFAVRFQSTTVTDPNTGEIKPYVQSEPIVKEIRDVSNQIPSTETSHSSLRRPQPTPRMPSLVASTTEPPRRTISRETVDSPTGFEPPEKRMRPADSRQPATLKEARELLVHTRYPNAEVVVGSRHLLSTASTSPSTALEDDASPRSYFKSHAEDDSHNRLIRFQAIPAPPVPPTASSENVQPERVPYFSFIPYNPFSPGSSSPSPVDSTTTPVHGGIIPEREPVVPCSMTPLVIAGGCETPVGIPTVARPEDNELKVTVPAEGKLPSQEQMDLPPLPMRRTSLLGFKRPASDRQPHGGKVPFGKPLRPARKDRPPLDPTDHAMKTPSPRDIAYSEEVVPHPARAEEIKRTGATLPERSRTISAVGSQKPATGGSNLPSINPAPLRRLFEDGATKATRGASPKSPRHGMKHSSPKRTSTALLEWEPPRTTDLKTSQSRELSVPVTERVAYFEQKRPAGSSEASDVAVAQEESTHTDKIPSTSQGASGTTGTGAPEKNVPVHRPGSLLAKPTGELVPHGGLIRPKLVLPAPPIERISPEKPKHLNRTLEDAFAVSGGRPVLRKSDDHSSTEPFSLDENTGKYSLCAVPSDPSLSTSSSSSISPGGSESGSEKEDPLPPRPAPRSRSSSGTPSDTADDSGPRHRELEIRRSIEYIPQGVTTGVRSSRATSDEKERCAKTPAPSRQEKRKGVNVASTRSPSPDHSPPQRRLIAIVEPEEPFSLPKDSPPISPEHSLQDVREGPGPSPSIKREPAAEALAGHDVQDALKTSEGSVVEATGARNKTNGKRYSSEGEKPSAPEASHRVDLYGAQDIRRDAVQEYPPELQSAGKKSSEGRRTRKGSSEVSYSYEPRETRREPVNDLGAPLSLLCELRDVQKHMILPEENRQEPQRKVPYGTPPTESHGTSTLERVIVPSQQVLFCSDIRRRQLTDTSGGKNIPPLAYAPELQQILNQRQEHGIAWSSIGAQPEAARQNRSDTPKRALDALPSPGQTEVTEGEGTAAVNRRQLTPLQVPPPQIIEVSEKPVLAGHALGNGREGQPPARVVEPQTRQKAVLPVPASLHRVVQSLRDTTKDDDTYNLQLPHERQVQQTHQSPSAAVRDYDSNLPGREERGELSGSPTGSPTTSSERNILELKPPTPPVYSRSVPFQQKTRGVPNLEPVPERLEVAEEGESAAQTATMCTPTVHHPDVQHTPTIPRDKPSSGSKHNVFKPVEKGLGGTSDSITGALPLTAGFGSPRTQQSTGHRKQQASLMSAPDILQAPLVNPDSMPVHSSPYRSRRQGMELPQSPPSSSYHLQHPNMSLPDHDSDLELGMIRPGFNPVYDPLMSPSDGNEQETASVGSRVTSRSAEDVRNSAVTRPEAPASGAVRQEVASGSTSMDTSPSSTASPLVTGARSRDSVEWNTPSPSGTLKPPDLTNVTAPSNVTPSIAESNGPPGTKTSDE